VRVVPSSKTIVGLGKNVTYKALSAEAGTAHGLSPVVAILDEVGQVKGGRSAFIEAIETSQGAYADALLIAISTQAATDGDLFSKWLDEPDAPDVVKRVYAAPQDAAVDDWAAIEAANPAMGVTPSKQYMEAQMERAKNSPAFENSFRWLHMNQRVTADNPFVSKSVWEGCNATPVIEPGSDVWLGLDLSSVKDLTALVMIAQKDGVWQVVPWFWLPGDGLADRAHEDRVPYDQWHKMGFLEAAPGKTVDLSVVAEKLMEVLTEYNVRRLAFDRWGWSRLEPELLRQGVPEWQLAEIKNEFGQGFRSMSPALMTLEADLINGRVAPGGHPVLAMCAANATVQSDPAGNRKLVKPKERHRRIDGMVALAMAHSVGVSESDALSGTPWDADPTFKLVL
jgi:phage terminase large subunit-like protein